MMDWNYGRSGASQNGRTLVLSRMEKKDCNIRIGMNGRMVKLGQVQQMYCRSRTVSRIVQRLEQKGVSIIRAGQSRRCVGMECTEDMFGTRQNGRMVQFGQNTADVLEDQERIEWKDDKTRKGQSRWMVGFHRIEWKVGWIRTGQSETMAVLRHGSEKGLANWNCYVLRQRATSPLTYILWQTEPPETWIELQIPLAATAPPIYMSCFIKESQSTLPFTH